MGIEFTIHKASDSEYEIKITLTSLEELMEFIEENCDINGVIISGNTIKIYDDYVE